MRKCSFLLAAFILVPASLCWAKVSIRNTKPLVIPIDRFTPKITKEDVAKVIPLDVTPEDSTSKVMSRIADRSFNLWFNSSAVKNSRFGRMAEETQEKLKTDVVVPAESPNGISHKISVRIEAFQAMAKMEYRGWLNAGINYDAKSSETNIEVNEEILDDKKLVVSHKVSKSEGLSMVGVGWSW